MFAAVVLSCSGPHNVEGLLCNPDLNACLIQFIQEADEQLDTAFISIGIGSRTDGSTIVNFEAADIYMPNIDELIDPNVGSELVGSATFNNHHVDVKRYNGYDLNNVVQTRYLNNGTAVTTNLDEKCRLSSFRKSYIVDKDGSFYSLSDDDVELNNTVYFQINHLSNTYTIYSGDTNSYMLGKAMSEGDTLHLAPRYYIYYSSLLKEHIVIPPKSYPQDEILLNTLFIKNSSSSMLSYTDKSDSDIIYEYIWRQETSNQFIELYILEPQPD